MEAIKKKIAKAQYDFINNRTARRRYMSSVRNAKFRSLKWSIKYSEYSIIIKNPCYFCGSTPIGGVIGLDRVDNSIGYVLSNVRPCCYICNNIRGDLPKDFFISVVYKIYNNLNGIVQGKRAKARTPKSKK